MIRHVAPALVAGMTLAACCCGQATVTPPPLGSGPLPSVIAPSASALPIGSMVTSPQMVDDEADQVIVLFGVANGGGPVTWTWDGQRWSQLQPSTTPPATIGGALAYDRARRDVVLFGGTVEGMPSAQTWTYKAGVWTAQHPSASPPARADASAAFDPTAQVVLVFGGCCSGEQYAPTPLNDTWAWDGTTWTQRSPSTAPPARQAASMVEDPGRNRLLLYGGMEQGKTTQASDTWTWDGHTWLAQNPAHAPAVDATLVAAAPHHASARVILFAGYGGAAQTWLWDGTSWTIVPVDFGPPARTRWIAAEDVAHNQVVLFDVVEGEGAETWIWDGSKWTRAA